MDDATWTAVDEYFGALAKEDDALAGANAAAAAAGLPAIQVSAAQGKLLYLLARAIGARRVLEVGTLAGYSAIWLARALPEDGELISLELEERHAAVARANLERAGVAGRASVRVGDARASIAALVAEGAGPFDLVFIDADKPSNPVYFAAAVALTRPGGLIVVDNVARGGAVADSASSDPSVLGVRELVDAAALDGRVEGTAIQTVGVKGYDGFALFRVV